MSQPITPPTATQSAARTDDLLASGAEPEDGAQGFDRDANPETLQTGMEGIAGTTAGKRRAPTGSNQSGISGTVQDNPGQVRGKPDGQ